MLNAIKKDNLYLVKILLVLQIINYMIGVVILNDNFLFKISRDVLLFFMLCMTVFKTGVPPNKGVVPYILFFVVIIFAFISSISGNADLNLCINSLRKYTFPIVVLLAVASIRGLHKYCITRFGKFILVALAIVSVWGVFQAWVLKDDFLIKIGYRTKFLYAYGDDMLGYSFYFGGLGIQRVVSTFSNSNVCALILGMTLIFIVSIYPYIKTKKEPVKDIAIVCILIGYILTFSRSNFLAGILISLFFLYPYIPYKITIFKWAIVLLTAGVCSYFTQGSEGVIYKIVGWIDSSLNFTDSSAAGRTDIWKTAFQGVIENPMGVGFGKVGALARDAEVVNYYSSENSYLAVCLDSGIVGLIIYLICLISMIRRLNHRAKRARVNNDDFSYRINIGAYTIIAYYMIVSFFSNHIYDMEVLTFMYVYVGIALAYTNISIKNKTERGACQ